MRALPLLTLPILLSAQTAPQRPSFDVASVRANHSDDAYTDYVPRRSGNRISMHNSGLAYILAWAYQLTDSDNQIIPGRWEKNVWNDSYDLDAIASGSTTDDDLRRMLQAVLADRFNLKFHRETRQLSGYELVAAPGGSHLTPAKQRDVKITLSGKSSWVQVEGNGKSRLIGRGASMQELATVLARQMQAPVRDSTGIRGMFDYDLTFSRGLEPSNAPFLTRAIHELGLDLRKGKTEVDVLVIDHLGKLAEN